MRKSISILITVLLMITGTVLSAQESPEYSPVQSKLGALGFQLPTQSLAAPDFTLKDLEGNDVALSSLKGKFVFLNFWATWCPPCRAEMPSMETLYNKYKKKDFTILAVNLREPEKTVEDFLDKNRYTFPVVLDASGQVGSALYGVSGIPTTYFIDKNGEIIGRLVGTREWDTSEIYEIIEELIN